MASLLLPFFSAIAVCLLLLQPCLASKKTYIVHMKHSAKPSSFLTHQQWYAANLQSLSESSSSGSLLYTYETAYKGFAAFLGPEEVEILRRSDAVVGVYEDTVYSLHTTRTPEFLGLDGDLGLWAGHGPQKLNRASQDVVGVLDTGVWPEAKKKVRGAQATQDVVGVLDTGVWPEANKKIKDSQATQDVVGVLDTGVWPESRKKAIGAQATQDVVIGVLDTGVWPESKSFDDAGMPEIPARWRGQCESAPDFDPKVHCNKKLIGARFFAKGYHMASGLVRFNESESPRDQDGHGTHTASTAAGSPVANASLFGYARGVARGMATHARVAAYKVCWKAGCFGSDILAAMEQAILDGVDVLSLSLGGGSAPYYRDTIAIGAFSAMQKGIFVSCSAGNSGPAKSSLANTAPWIMTVGAGTIDRDFPAYANLGDGRKFTGVSLYSGKGMGKKLTGLVYSAGNNSSSNLCLPGSIDPKLVKGKVVVCDRGTNARVEKGLVVRRAGGVGMILANTEESGEELVADSHLLPAVAVGKKMGDLIRQYVKTATKPTAVLSFGGTVLNVKPSPVVASFSSRGPNMVTPQILKPDVIGPGVNILAAWSLAVGPTGLDEDTRKTPFNIMSGTSMSCPHISGLAALLKAAHPEWSPAAIKSALMTTAYARDNTNSPLRQAEDFGVSNAWAYGSGHVDPHKALSPGLVYDIRPSEYIRFLCSLDYAAEHIQAIVKRPNITCDKKFADPGQLNYPSFSVLFGKSRVVRYTRILTNVGVPRSTYDVAVEAPSSVAVTVKPAKLFFKNVGNRLRYTVTFVSKKGVTGKDAFGSISWNNAQNQVRSPVAFTWPELF